MLLKVTDTCMQEEYLVVLRVHAGSEKKGICCGVVEDDGLIK